MNNTYTKNLNYSIYLPRCFAHLFCLTYSETNKRIRCFLFRLCQGKKEIFVSMGRDIAIKSTIVLVHVIKKEWGGGKFRQKHFSLQDFFLILVFGCIHVCSDFKNPFLTTLFTETTL